MSDMIDRQAAIDVFYKLWGTSLTRTIDAIKALPSAQQWIPSNERLPETGQFVLAYIITPDGGYMLVTAFYGECYWYDGTIPAWMPLPEPYQKGD